MWITQRSMKRKKFQISRGPQERYDWLFHSLYNNKHSLVARHKMTLCMNMRIIDIGFLWIYSNMNHFKQAYHVPIVSNYHTPMSRLFRTQHLVWYMLHFSTYKLTISSHSNVEWSLLRKIRFIGMSASSKYRTSLWSLFIHATTSSIMLRGCLGSYWWYHRGQ